MDQNDESSGGSRRDFLINAGIAALSASALTAENALANTLKPFAPPPGPLKADPRGRFAGKVVLVTGSTAGLGAQVATEFAREGAKVAVHGRSSDKAEKILTKIKGMGGEARFFPADVRNEAEMKKLVEDVVGAYGGLHIAVNAAAIFHTGTQLADLPFEKWTEVLETNANGVFLSMKHELLAMERQKGGVIVNICSGASHQGQAEAPAYTASKHAVLGLTKAAAKGYAAKNIRVNAISPSQFDHVMGTDKKLSDFPAEAKAWAARSPSGRLATIEELARMVLWLASDEASYVIGHSLILDGGINA